jgi:hypothetical protein
LAVVVVEIDYEKKELGFYDVATYRLEGDGQTFPVTLQDSLPMIQAKFDLANQSFSGIFEIDTGSTGAIQINTPLFAATIYCHWRKSPKKKTSAASAGRQTRWQRGLKA